jgi:hypothetical protein
MLTYADACWRALQVEREQARVELAQLKQTQDLTNRQKAEAEKRKAGQVLTLLALLVQKCTC